MKKRLFLLWLACALLLTPSCSSAKEEPKKTEDFMKIKTLIVNPALEGTGYWQTDPELLGYGGGYWVSEDGAEIPMEQVFIEDELEVGVPRTLAPLNYDKLGVDWGGSVKLQFDFEGVLEIETEEPESNSIRLAYWQAPSTGNGFKNKVEVNTIRVNAPVKIEVCPVGKELVVEGLQYLGVLDTIVYKEYMLYAKAYKQSGEFIASAEIKLTAIPDAHYPWQTIHEGRYSEIYRAGEERSPFLTVEVVSYEYSDTYKMMME